MFNFVCTFVGTSDIL